MKFKLCTQHLQQLPDPPHCQLAGRWPSVRKLQAALLWANRWAIERDAFKTDDGIMIVNYQTWTWLGTTLRSKVVESFAFVATTGPECMPTTNQFLSSLLPTLADKPEMKAKVRRFQAIGKGLEGDYCSDYRPIRSHITTCPYCSSQFTKSADDWERVLLETQEKNRQTMKKWRDNNAQKRPQSEKVRARAGKKYNYALFMCPDSLD